MIAAGHVFNPLRSRRRTYSRHELDEQDGVRAHWLGVIPSDGGSEGSALEWEREVPNSLPPGTAVEGE